MQEKGAINANSPLRYVLWTEVVNKHDLLYDAPSANMPDGEVRCSAALDVEARRDPTPLSESTA